VISLDGVTHSFGLGTSRRVVLDDVTVRVDEQRVGVIGANGSGKSTFARLLNGLVLPDRGTVTIDGLDPRRDGKEVRRRVGFVFTDPDAQIVMPTVQEDVAFGLKRRGLTSAELAERVARALADFGLAELADSPAHSLSGGEKQLLALCSVLVTEPTVLVLDEPTTLLDLRNAHRIGELLDSLAQQVVLVTHHLELLAAYDRVLVFDEGRLVCDDSPAAAIDVYRRLMA
jgi:biotin transport system ATP-binding protein